MTNREPTRLELIGRAFHKAALRAETIVNAIPEDADAYEEGAVMEVAYARPAALAEFIGTLPAASDEEKYVKARAAAWLDGRYWPTENAVPADEART